MLHARSLLSRAEVSKPSASAGGSGSLNQRGFSPKSALAAYARNHSRLKKVNSKTVTKSFNPYAFHCRSASILPSRGHCFLARKSVTTCFSWWSRLIKSGGFSPNSTRCYLSTPLTPPSNQRRPPDQYLRCPDIDPFLFQADALR